MIRVLLIVALLVVGATAAHAQPIAHRGSTLAWDAPVIDADHAAPTRYDIRFDTGAWIPTGMLRVWPIPPMTSGAHTVRVRACNADGCSDADNALTVALLAFVYANAVPGAPTNLIHVPPATPIASVQEGTDLIQAYWFIASGGKKLNGRELQDVILGYTGELPPTWGSSLGYLDRLLAAR